MNKFNIIYLLMFPCSFYVAESSPSILVIRFHLISLSNLIKDEIDWVQIPEEVTTKYE